MIEKQTLSSLLSSMRKCRFRDNSGLTKTGKKWLLKNEWKNYELDKEVITKGECVFLHDKNDILILTRE